MLKIKNIIVLLFIVLSFFTSKASSKSDQTAFDFYFNSIQEIKYPLNQHKGKVLMIVNVASQCGFTKQYEDLQKLHDEYKDQGLVLIGVPSNDFGSQEYKSNEKVNDFCKTNFNITFLLTEITRIKGKDGHPFFKWASNQSGLLSFPKWNFYKYLINKEGEVHSWYSSVTKPKSKKITNAIDFLISSK